jgi:glutaredoxin
MAEPTVTVYTRENCHLCTEALSTVHSVAESVSRSVTIELVDVDERADLQEEYGDRVPYVLIDGTPKFKYRVNEGELREALSEG